MSAESDLGWFITDPHFCFFSLKNLLQFWGSGRVTSFLQFFTEPEASWMPGFVCDEIWRYYTQGRKRFHAIWCNLVRFGAIRCDFMRFDFQKKRATQPRAAKQTGPTERKSGGYVIAPKSHLTAKKRHLSLSHCTSSTSNHTHTLLLAFCRGARVYIFTQPRAAKQTGHTSYTHTGARGGGLQDYIHTQVPEVPECTFSLNPAPPSRLGRLTAWQDRQEDIDPEFARLYGPYLLTLG